MSQFLASVPKYWSLSFNISSSNEYSGLISFTMDWLDLLAVQGTLKSLLQHHSSKASILRRSVSFLVQLSHPHMTTGKTIASTRWTFVGKVMSLLFNMLSRLVITSLPRSKHFLISRLQSQSRGFSVQFSRSVVSKSLWTHEAQYSRPPCPSPTPGVHPNACPLCRWCHPTTSILCCPLLLLPSIFPSIRVSSNESPLLIRWPKYWSFSFNISPSNEHPGLISLRMDCLDLLAVQGTLKSLLQHHSSKASIFQRSAFFTVQLSHPYMTTGKTIALTRPIFVGNVMSLLFNMLSRLVITFLPRSKRLLISWLQSPSAVIWELQK